MCIQSYIHLYLYICIYVQMYICTCVSVHQVHYRNARNARRVQQTRNSTKDIHICIHVNHRNARNARRIQRRRAIQLYIYIYICIYVHHRNTRNASRYNRRAIRLYIQTCMYICTSQELAACKTVTTQARNSTTQWACRFSLQTATKRSIVALPCLVFLQCVLAVCSCSELLTFVALCSNGHAVFPDKRRQSGPSPQCCIL